jgi:hypothetical protein
MPTEHQTAYLEHLLMRHTRTHLCLQLIDMATSNPTVAALTLQPPTNVEVRLTFLPGDENQPLAAALLSAGRDANALWMGTHTTRTAIIPVHFLKEALKQIATISTLRAAIVTRRAGLWVLF